MIVGVKGQGTGSIQIKTVNIDEQILLAGILMAISLNYYSNEMTGVRLEVVVI